MLDAVQKFLDSIGLERIRDWIKSNFVNKTTKVNGKALSSDILLTASDVGAITQAELDASIQSAIQDSWASSY